MRNFSVLSDVEFENLVADLLASQFGVPVERFAAGRDGGVDLRWRGAAGLSIGQCKHYQRSNFSKLLAAAGREVAKVENLAPSSYKFITSFDLAVGQKSKIYKLFARWMDSPDDVMGGGDIDGLLTLHPNVERRHPKLWVTSGMQLFWAAHSDLLNRAEALKQRIEKSVPRYVVNEGYSRARNLLEENNVCLISGVPGIGKTMLARMLLAEHISLGFEPVEVSSDINEAWTALESSKPQIFLYDDFLGQITFSERLGKNEDARLSDLIERFSDSQTKKLILTTREYILRDARLSYERLSDLEDRFQFVLALRDYSRRDKAQILYNHLWHSDLSSECLREIADGGYKKIVDHATYNPRLIEYCTSKAFDLTSTGFPARVVETFENPEKIWRIAFDRHLTQPQRLLLCALSGLPTATNIEVVQRVHASLSRELSIPVTEASFKECLEVLEETFLSITRSDRRETEISFMNPSVAEFTLGRLAADRTVLRGLIAATPYFDQVAELFRYSAQGGDRLTFSAALDGLASDVATALSRALLGPSVVSADVPWKPDGSIESRLIFCFENREKIPFESTFLEQATAAIVERWEQRQGNKVAGVKLLLKIDSSKMSRLEGVAHEVLHEWLEESLDEAEEWNAFLDHMVIYHNQEVFEDEELAGRFENFMESEFSRWSPRPPHLESLRDIAESFGLEDLMEAIDDALRDEGDWERDESYSPSRISRNELGSDAALQNLFSRLIDN
ncbi:nSTAND3 domain-containing NTPase [Streptomyces sp. NPDC001492]